VPEELRESKRNSEDKVGRAHDYVTEITMFCSRMSPSKLREEALNKPSMPNESFLGALNVWHFKCLQVKILISLVYRPIIG
jgi:hypothetical protein